MRRNDFAQGSMIYIFKAQSDSEVNSAWCTPAPYSCKSQHMAFGSGQSGFFRKLPQSHSSWRSPKGAWDRLRMGSGKNGKISAHPLYIPSKCGSCRARRNSKRCPSPGKPPKVNRDGNLACQPRRRIPSAHCVTGGLTGKRRYSAYFPAPSGVDPSC